jgi:hypothetical protein
MKNLGEILCIPVILMAGNCFSQQVIATAGSTATGAGIELSWTIGEPVTATAPGSGFFLTQGFHQGQPVIQINNQEIGLTEGWNIVSARVIPDNKDMMDVFQTMISTGYLKKVMNEEGKTLEDWGVYGGWTNGIGNLTSTEGYKVNVKTNTDLSVDGAVFIFPFHIQLTEGWNIISWPSPNDQEGMDVFNALIDAGKLKKVMNESGQTIEDWGIFGGWKNNIGNLQPGEGYNVNVNSDCILIINESGTKSEVILPNPVASTHFIPAFKGNGTDHMNIYLVNLAESGIKTGDEIGVFDENVCVGAVKIPNQFLSDVSIPVSANDGLEEKNGFTVGNNIEMRLFRNGLEYPVTLQPLSESGAIFKKGSSLFAQLDLTTGTEGLPGLGFTEINCYPNPFSEEVNIEIKLVKDSEIQVEVLNQLGQKVKIISTKQIVPGGLHKLTWNGRNENNSQVSPGIYHLRTEIDNSVIINKVVLSK